VIWKSPSWRWLLPGMRVKRYAALAGLGFLLALFGVGLASAGAPFPELARWLLARGSSPVAVGVLLVAVGTALLILGLRAMNRSILAVLTDPDRVPELVYRRRRLEAGPRIAALGGGTGLSRLLRGLKRISANTTAVVAVTDDGGSTGRLRRAFDIPAVGDLVDCLAALSEAPRAQELMQYRFARGGELEGHTFGNLFLVTLHELTGSFSEALRSANRLLALSGAVWPSTCEPAVLVAEFSDGRRVEGETAIRAARGRIERLRLSPPDPEVMPEVVRALERAELVILGPGSLYTSVIASFLPEAVRKALVRTPARLVQVVNLMTEPGETDGMDAFAHVEALARHLGRWPEVAVVHTAPIPLSVRQRYIAEGQHPVAYDPKPFLERGIRVLSGDFREEGPLAQHDPKKLVAAVQRLFVQKEALM